MRASRYRTNSKGRAPDGAPLHPRHPREPREPTRLRHRAELLHEPAHLRELLQLRVEVVERELRIEELFRLLLGLLPIDVLLRALDEGEDVAHAEDALRE